MGSFLSDASNQRKIAVALAALLGLFANKVPFLASIQPEVIVTVIATIAAWVLQSGHKAAAEATADGVVAAARITNGEDAAVVLGGNPPPVKTS